MCGRYTNTARDPQVIMQRFDITISPAVAERALGRANIAPTQSVLAVVNGEDGSREAVLARFGLAPAWAKLRGGPITYRHPAVAANIAATIDHISGGRAENGVGAAWFEQEHREYGIPTGTGTICKGARHLVEEPVDTEIVCGRVAPASLPDHHLGVVDADGNLTRRVIFERWKPAWWSNPLTGATVPYTQTNKFTVVLAVPGDLDSATTTIVGETIWTDPQTHQKVLRSVGRQVLAADEAVEFRSGQQPFLDAFVDGDMSVFDAVCAALAS
jgi:hypothetical protein